MPPAPERTWTRSQTWFAIQKPRPRAPSRAGSRRSASGSVEPAGVGDLAHDGRGVAPEAQHARAAAVLEAVARDLVRGEDELDPPVPVHPCLRGVLVHEGAQPLEPAVAELELRRVGGRGREDVTDEGARRVRVAPRAAARGRDDRVASPRLLDDLGGQGLDVVRADEPERRIREREVEQRLVPLALDELVARAGGPDRLADAAQGQIRRVRAHELLPGWDDPGRVGADLLHVGEPHRRRRPRRARRGAGRSSAPRRPRARARPPRRPRGRTPRCARRTRRRPHRGAPRAGTGRRARGCGSSCPSALSIARVATGLNAATAVIGPPGLSGLESPRCPPSSSPTR